VLAKQPAAARRGAAVASGGPSLISFRPAFLEAKVKAITAVKPGDGFEHWHQVTCRSYSLTECRRVADRRFAAQITIRELGALAISALSTTTPPEEPIHVTRSPADIRRDPRDYFMLWLMLDGQIGLAQNGRSALMQPGDLFVYDQSRPFVLDFGPHTKALMVTIPRPLLNRRFARAHQLGGRRIAADSSVGPLAGSLVAELYRLEHASEDVASRLGASALEMLVTAVEGEADSGSEPAEHQDRLARAKRFILANLDDPTLELGRIARSQDMAPRTLYRLFAAEGTTPIRWLWQQRLAASFAALTEGKVAKVTDAALGHGFSDVSHFSRTFKTAFGHAPSTFARKRRR
jgi:AraC-like DNA-binding protein